MNPVSQLFGLLLIVATACDPAHAATPFQSEASFEAAIHNYSTAPSYVLITVVDARSATARSTCTTANLLLGALHREYDLEFDAAGQYKAEQFALANKSHSFRFTRQQAIDNVPLYFSDSDLAYVREKLQALSTSQLREGFSATGELHQLYQAGPLERHKAYRDAVACFLIERGLSPGTSDRSDRLWIAQ